MLIIHFLTFIFFCIFTILSVSGLGFLLNKNKKNFLLNFFSGYLILAILITFIHFFFPINLIITIIISLIGFFLSINNYQLSFKNFDKKYYFIILIFFILIPIFISQKYHEDFGYYHLPHVINLVNEKIIFGIGNINNGFIHNSIWLNVLSLFYFNNNYNFITLPIFLLYFIFIIYSINQITSNVKCTNSNYFLIICNFYLLLKFTRISEFGNDIPSLIYSILGIFFFLKYEEENNINKKKYFFFTHISFVAFAILVKFSVIPICILSIYIFLRDFKIINRELFKYNYLIIYFLVIIFFVQQFIYTGCFIFPSKITCLNVSWFNNEFLNLSTKLQLVNKSYSVARDFISIDEYLENFNWVPYWFKRNYLEITEHILTMLLPIIIFLSLLKKKVRKIDKINNLKIIIFFLIMGFGFWFTFSPVYRFGIIYFICLTYIISVKFYNQKIFSKEIFISLMIIFLTFNFLKNVKRIYHKNYLVFGIDRINNEYILYDDYLTDKRISVFKPDITSNNLKGNGWQGRLCWDIPFICSYNKIKVNLIGNYYVISKLN